MRRNSLDPFLTVFDAPVPATTKGRRDSTNVPAQSLTMMNDSFVINAAHELARNAPGSTEEEKLSNMFRLALGRPASEVEKDPCGGIHNGCVRGRSQGIGREKRWSEKNWAENSLKLKEILEPARNAILKSRKSSPSGQSGRSGSQACTGISATGGRIRSLGLPVIPKAGPKIENGVLIVRGGGYVVTDVIPLKISEKNPRGLG